MTPQFSMGCCGIPCGSVRIAAGSMSGIHFIVIAVFIRVVRFDSWF